MQDTHHLLLPSSPSTTTTTTPKFPKFPSLSSKPNTPSHSTTTKFPNHRNDFPSLSIQPNTPPPPPPLKQPPTQLHHYHDFPSLPKNTPQSQPPSKSPNYPSKPQKLPPNHTNDFPSQLPQDFHAKLLYLDSLGLDFLSLIRSHPPILHTPLPTLTAAASFLLSPSAAALSLPGLRRAASTCPEILTLPVPSRLGPALAFLLREARVPHSALPRTLSRRPRLLALPVASRLRPALLFLHSIGVHSPHLHTNLLTSSVEDKLLPRIHFFHNLGFSRPDATAMFRRFPQLFCYSIRENYEPKLNYFVVEMGRDLRELKEFPQYFSFSLENRIKPRHQSCVERGVCFPLPVLLKTSNAKFRQRLEVCCETSMPVNRSPLWCTNCDTDLLLLKQCGK